MSRSNMKTILMADDDLDLNDTIRELLQDEGYRVHAFTDGSQVLNWLEKGKADLLLIDGCMPVLGGLEVLAEIGRQGKKFHGLPIILMSADDPKGLQEEYGWTRFLKKPMGLNQLTELISNLVH